MSAEELSAKTVIELRRLAREMGVPLRAGIAKAGIVECLCGAFAKIEAEKAKEAGLAEEDGHQLTMDEAIAEAKAAEAEPKPAVRRRGPAKRKTAASQPEAPEAPAAPEKAAPEAAVPAEQDAVPVAPAAPEAPAAQNAPAATPAAPLRPAQPAAGTNPQFYLRYSNNNPPRYNSRQPMNQQPRPAGGSWGTGGRALQQQDPAPRMGTVRPNGYTPRFGPGAAPEQQPQRSGYRDAQNDDNRGYNRPASQDRRPEQPAYGQRAA